MDTTTPNNAFDGAAPTPDRLREEGAAYLRQGRFADAVRVLYAALEASPEDEVTWRLLGGALSSQGEHAQAVEAFRRAVALVPDAARNHYNLGVALEAAGDRLEAEAALARAMELDPGYDQARARLSILQSRATPTYEMPRSGAAAMDVPSGDVPSGGVPVGSVYNSVPALRSDVADAPPPPLYSAGGPMGAAYAPSPLLGQSQFDTMNTSGTKGTVPHEIRGGWNWGAFWFSWLWLINHGLVGWGIGLFFISLIPYLGGLVALGAHIYLGIQGNELGWQNRRFESTEHFKLVQKIWGGWILKILAVYLAFLILAVIISLLAGGSSSSSRF
jgi:tetratricopeptide (TPR) repeat protein